MKVRKLAVLAAIVLLFTTRVLDAHSGNNTISGLVKDSTRAALRPFQARVLRERFGSERV